MRIYLVSMMALLTLSNGSLATAAANWSEKTILPNGHVKYDGIVFDDSSGKVPIVVSESSIVGGGKDLCSLFHGSDKFEELGLWETFDFYNRHLVYSFQSEDVRMATDKDILVEYIICK